MIIVIKKHKFLSKYVYMSTHKLYFWITIDIGNVNKSKTRIFAIKRSAFKLLEMVELIGLRLWKRNFDFIIQKVIVAIIIIGYKIVKKYKVVVRWRTRLHHVYGCWPKKYLENKSDSSSNKNWQLTSARWKTKT